MAGIDMGYTRRARAFKVPPNARGAVPAAARMGRLGNPWRQALPATLLAANLLVGCGPDPNLVGQSDEERLESMHSLYRKYKLVGFRDTPDVRATALMAEKELGNPGISPQPVMQPSGNRSVPTKTR